MRKRRVYGVLLLITALLIWQIPVPEADAASASDFQLNGNTLVKYTGTAETVSVSSAVEKIGKSAFENNTDITKLVMPNSVRKIGEYAFWGCTNLETVQLGSGLKEIGDFAFANCSGLKELSLPSTIESIGIRSFTDCVNFTDIYIPPEVTSIHETAFDGCPRLTIHYQAGSYAEEYAKAFRSRQAEMPEYEDVESYGSGSVSQGDVLVDDRQNQQNEQDDQGGQEGQESQEGVVSPSEGSLIGSTHVVGNRAVVFVDNTKLSTNGGSVGQTGEGVPDNIITVLPDTLLPEKGGSLPKYAVVEQSIIADQAYYGNQGMSSLNMPDEIEEIGQFSFARSSLQQADIKEGVLRIGYGAFYHCDSLSGVTLPDTVMTVEPKAFSHTKWVEQFLQGDQGDFLISGGVLVAYKGNHSSPEIPEGVRVIGAEAFAGHSEITEIILPDSLLVIGEGAFEGCSGLARIRGGENVIEIQDRAFGGCPLKSIEIPGNVEKIGLGALEGAETVIFYGSAGSGNALPGLSMEASAGRLSNESFRAPALKDVTFAVIDSGITEEELKDTVLCSGAAPFRGIIGSINDSGQLLCRFTNLSEQESRELSLPETVSIHGAVYEVTGMDGIKSLAADSTPPISEGIRVISEIDGVMAEMEGAEGGYELNLQKKEEFSKLESAYERIYHTGLPENIVVYDITLKESETGVSLTKLGSSEVTIAIPLPEALKGQNIQVLTLDRNGQLEAIGGTVLQEEGMEYVVFSTNHFSVFGFYGKGEWYAEETVVDGQVFISGFGKKDESPDTGDGIHPKWFLGAGVLFAGFALLLGKRKA